MCTNTKFCVGRAEYLLWISKKPCYWHYLVYYDIIHLISLNWYELFYVDNREFMDLKDWLEELGGEVGRGAAESFDIYSTCSAVLTRHNLTPEQTSRADSGSPFVSARFLPTEKFNFILVNIVNIPGKLIINERKWQWNGKLIWTSPYFDFICNYDC